MRWIVLLLLISFTYGYIGISVMLPLDAVTKNGLKDPDTLRSNLRKLKSGGVDGVMADVWWGLVEDRGARLYDWSAYNQMVQIVQGEGLKLQPVMSFHQCGTNVGDQCNVTLPSWVLQIGTQNPDIFYRDQQKYADKEYLSLGIDNRAVLAGRSAIEVYNDFMLDFARNFNSYLGTTIDEIQIGMGPAGELRYPSYQLQDNRWQYCGIGEFQCYDKHMLEDLKVAASNANHPEWGNGGPNNAGNYNSHPDGTGFFSQGFDNYQTDYGKFFLGWYSDALITHGDNILKAATKIFAHRIELAVKISGIHWWYSHPSHAAELTAGYYNTNQNDAYLKLAQLFAKHNVTFDFTCLEMFDGDESCGSRPVQLVAQTRLAANKVGLRYSGENALPICQPNCDQNKFNQVFLESTKYGNINRFTFLRLDDNLLNGNNWNMFTAFVARMHAV